jgi:hypothetical protein
MATAAALGRNARSMVLPVANPPGQSSLALATRRAVLSTGAALGSAVVVPFTNHERFVAVADDRIPFQAFQVESSSQSPKLNTIDARFSTDVTGDIYEFSALSLANSLFALPL